jgi:hypothetical protein
MVMMIVIILINASVPTQALIKGEYQELTPWKKTTGA